MTCHRVGNKGNTTGATRGALRNLPEHPSLPLLLVEFVLLISLVFCVVFCWSLFVILSFFFCPLYYQSYLNLRFLKFELFWKDIFGGTLLYHDWRLSFLLEVLLLTVTFLVHTDDKIFGSSLFIIQINLRDFLNHEIMRREILARV